MIYLINFILFLLSGNQDFVIALLCIGNLLLALFCFIGALLAPTVPKSRKNMIDLAKRYLISIGMLLVLSLLAFVWQQIPHKRSIYSLQKEVKGRPI